MSSNPVPRSLHPVTRNLQAVSSNGSEDHLIPINLHVYPVAVQNVAFKYIHRQRVFDVLLDHALQGLKCARRASVTLFSISSRLLAASS